MARTLGAGRMHRLLLAVASLVLLVGGLTAGAAARTGADAATAKKVLRLGVLSVGDPTNPAKNNSTNGQILSIAYAPLLYLNANGSLRPALATKWRFVGGNKNFELTLRRDARFSDGTRVTAPAVAGWLEYYAASKNSQSGLFGPNPKFRALDRWTVRITLQIPNPSLPRYLTQQSVNWPFVASPAAVANPDLFTKATYGAGPYKLDYAASVPGDHYLYVPNPYYYDKSAIHLRQLYVKVFADGTSMFQALEAGQLDAVAQAVATTAPAAEKAGFQVVSAPYATANIQLNVRGSKPLADVRVRRAMNYALDRKAIARTVYGKYATGTSQFLTTADADPGLQNYYAYSPAKAKALLAEAGYPNGFPFTLDYIPAYEQLAGLVAHYLDAVGIETKLSLYTTSAAYFDTIFKFKDDAWILAAGNGGQTPSNYFPWIGPTSSFKGGQPVNPKVDRLYYTGLKAKDSSKYWKQMWGLVTTDAWWLPTATSDAIWLASKSLDGVKMSTRRPVAYAIEWSFK